MSTKIDAKKAIGEGKILPALIQITAEPLHKPLSLAIGDTSEYKNFH